MAQLSPSFDYNALQESINQSPDPLMTPDSIATPQSDEMFFDEIRNRTRFVMYRAVSPPAPCYVANTVGGDWMAPFYGSVISFFCFVDTPGTTSTMSIDLRMENAAHSSYSTIGTMTVATTAGGSVVSSYTNPNGVPFNIGTRFHVNVTATNTTPALGLTWVIKIIESTTHAGGAVNS